jgi:hypothetical protein
MGKTLLDELKQIVKYDLLKKDTYFICHNLSEKNSELIKEYREMASNYAPEYSMKSSCWWNVVTSERQGKIEYLILEKYRFINDLIQILEQQNK